MTGVIVFADLSAETVNTTDPPVDVGNLTSCVVAVPSADVYGESTVMFGDHTDGLPDSEIVAESGVPPKYPMETNNSLGSFIIIGFLTYFTG